MDTVFYTIDVCRLKSPVLYLEGIVQPNYQKNEEDL